MSAFDKLYEGSDSAEAALRAALRNIEELARYDARFNEAAQQIQSARAAVGDVSSQRARLCRRHQRIAGAPGRNRRSPGAVRSPEAQSTARRSPKSSRSAKTLRASWRKLKIATRLLKTLRAEVDKASAAYRAAAAHSAPSAKLPPQSWPNSPKRRSIRWP